MTSPINAPNPYDLLPKVQSFSVTSNDIVDGHPLDLRHVHGWAGGQNLSPHLQWSGFPAETKSFAVTCFDPDAPTGSGWWHWLAINIAVSVNELTQNAGASTATLPSGAFHVRNDFSDESYGGAAPPPGHGTHRYIFAVHALGIDKIDVTNAASPAMVGFNLTFNTLARATITPTYAR